MLCFCKLPLSLHFISHTGHERQLKKSLQVNKVKWDISCFTGPSVFICYGCFHIKPVCHAVFSPLFFRASQVSNVLGNQRVTVLPDYLTETHNWWTVVGRSRQEPCTISVTSHAHDDNKYLHSTSVIFLLDQNVPVWRKQCNNVCFLF